MRGGTKDCAAISSQRLPVRTNINSRKAASPVWVLALGEVLPPGMLATDVYTIKRGSLVWVVSLS